MSIPVTVCGLIAKQGIEPFAWETLHYWEDLSEPDPAVALEFVRQKIHAEGLGNGNAICTALAARVHPGHIHRCAGFQFADSAVDGDAEMSKYPEPSLYTVCGVYLGSGEPYSELWMSHGPALAYVDAWQAARDDRADTLLLACVHEGEYDADEALIKQLMFPYADTSCDTAEEMLAVMREWAPKPVVECG